MLPFPGFEAFVDPKILHRGVDYFRNDTVQDICPSGHTWRATVSGTEDYRVKVTIKNEEVTAWSCTCPYEGGPICKHVVALLLTLQETEETTGLDQAAKSPASGPSSIEDLVNTLTPAQLREALLLCCDQYPLLREELSIRYLPADKDGKERIATLVRQTLRKLKARYDNYSWEDRRGLADSFDTLIDRAQEGVDTGNHRQAADTALVLVENLLPALEEVDDSDGLLGDTVDAAFAVLEQLSTTDLPLPMAAELFAYFLKAFQKGLGAGFDFRWRWLEMAVDLVQTNEEEQQLLSVLDHYKPPRELAWFQDFENEQVLEIKLALFRKTRTPEDVARLEEENLRFPALRLAAIEQAYAAKDWERVKRLCHDGARQAREDKLPGLEIQWHEWLLKVAHQQKDKPTQIAEAEFLLEHDYHLLDSYRLLKALVPVFEWPERRARYMAFMKEHYAEHTIMQILLEEGKADELEALVGEHSSLDFLLTYERPLLDNHPAIVRRQFAPLVLGYLEQVTGRAYYQTVASFLKRLKKKLGKEVVGPVASELRTRYRTRRALLEELQGI